MKGECALPRVTPMLPQPQLRRHGGRALIQDRVNQRSRVSDLNPGELARKPCKLPVSLGSTSPSPAPLLRFNWQNNAAPVIGLR